MALVVSFVKQRANTKRSFGYSAMRDFSLKDTVFTDSIDIDVLLVNVSHGRLVVHFQPRPERIAYPCISMPAERIAYRCLAC